MREKETDVYNHVTNFSILNPCAQITFALGSGTRVKVLVGLLHLQSLLDELKGGGLIGFCLSSEKQN